MSQVPESNDGAPRREWMVSKPGKTGTSSLTLAADGVSIGDAETPPKLLDPALSPTQIAFAPAAKAVEASAEGQLGPSRPGSFRFLLGLLGLLVRGRLTGEERARRLGAFFAAHGGLWVKLAQLLALRRDLLPEAYWGDLAEPGVGRAPIPFSDVRRIVEEELGSSLELHFDEFDEHPIAVMPEAQVHRARLRREGAVVSVKVQHPDLAERFKADHVRIRKFTTRLARFAFGVELDWDDILWELDQFRADSLDYRIEATYMARSRKKFRKHRVYVPVVFTPYCRQRLLVKEWVDGVPMLAYMRAKKDDPKALLRWLAENEVEPTIVGRRIYLSMMRQVMEEDFFHSAWHPGNLFLLRKNWVSIVDFWAMSSLESSFRKKYSMFSRAIFDREYTKAADLLMLLCPALPPTVQTEDVREQIVRVLRVFEVKAHARNMTVHEKSLSRTMGEIVHILARFRIHPGWTFMRIHQAHVTLERSLSQLIPDANYMKLGERYWKEARKRLLKQGGDSKAKLRGMSSLVSLLREAPEMLAEQMVFQGESVRRRAKSFRLTTSKLAELLEVVCGLMLNGLVVGGFALYWIFLDQHYHWVIRFWHMSRYLEYTRGFPVLDTVVWFFLFAVIVNVGIKLLRLKRRFAQKEVKTEESGS